MRIENSAPSNSFDSSHGRFTETRWSLVAGLDLGEVERRRCLAELCGTYSYPVYAHIRRAGYDDQDAYDFTLAFFERLIDGLHERQPEGRFRTFLLERLDEFLQDPGKPDGPEGALSPPDREELAARFETNQARSPKVSSFDAEYAREILAHGLQRLRSEAQRNGRLEMFKRLVPFLAQEPTAAQYERLAGDLNMSRVGLVVALKRLRARFNELVNRELSETVDNPEDLESERMALHRVMRGEH